MAITGTTGIPLAEAKPLYPTVGKKSMDSLDFMKLFITQLKYQDPSKPMDSYEMSAQLAQFSSMEATMKMSTNMEKLVASQTSQNNLQVLTMLDREVLAKGNSIALAEGKAAEVEFDLFDDSNRYSYEVYDENANLVWKKEWDATKINGDPPIEAGTHKFTWEGKNLMGNEASDGVYFFKLQAKRPDGQNVDVNYRMNAKVTGLSFDNGAVALTLNKKVNIGVADVLEVR